jgi:dynein heavy chain
MGRCRFKCMIFAHTGLTHPATLTRCLFFASAASAAPPDPYDPKVRPLVEPLVAASVELYRCVVRDMLPTPSKSHYLFNTRDLAKLVLGVMQVGRRGLARLL